MRGYKQDHQRLITLIQELETYLLGVIQQAEQVGGATSFYRQQYEALQIIQREVLKKLATAEHTAQQLVWDGLTHAFNAGVAETGASAAAVVSANALAQIAAETRTMVRGQFSQMFRHTMDTYRELARLTTAETIASGQGVNTMARRYMRKLADQGITSFVDNAGRRWSMESYAEMVMRTGVMRARMEGRIAGFVASGVDLVRVSEHPDCAPQCQPYQGRVLAVSGGAGARIVFTPTGEAETVQVVATLREAMEHGYKHPNCRHVETPYLGGGDEPSLNMGSEDMTAVYKLRQQERHYRRQARRWQRRHQVAATRQERAAAWAKVKHYRAQRRETLATYERAMREANSTRQR